MQEYRKWDGRCIVTDCRAALSDDKDLFIIHDCGEEEWHCPECEAVFRTEQVSGVDRCILIH